MPEVTILRRTTAFAYYDHNMVVLAERLTDHLPAPPEERPRQRLWRVRAKQVVLATGALERPIRSPTTTARASCWHRRPRPMPTSMRSRTGSRAVVFTNNDSAYGAARDLAASGIEVVAMVDVAAKDARGPRPRRRAT